MGDTEKDNRVILGFSGGADSTAAALILKKAGYDVTGLYFQVSKTPDEQEALQVKAVADFLDIPLIIRNVNSQFSDMVERPFCEAYALGQTPNPCVLCNPAVKFKTLFQEADSIGASLVATGHWASVKDGNIYKAVNIKKDQSYMLYRLPKEMLNRLILPLGDIESKDNVREFLRQNGVPNAEKKDSQDICFIPDGDYKAYLKMSGLQSRPGDFVDDKGNVLGHHSGVQGFTIGQRKGLGIAFGHPMFVKALVPERNQVVLGLEDELYEHMVRFSGQFYSDYGSVDELPAEYRNRSFSVKLRYTAREAMAVATAGEDGKAVLTFESPQRAPANGQSAVLYTGDKLIGGGFIV